MAESDPKVQLQKLLDDEEQLKTIAAGIMKELDKDNSGALEINEVKELIESFCENEKLPADKRPSEKEIQEAFDKLDTDKSGAVELGELVVLVRGIITDMMAKL